MRKNRILSLFLVGLLMIGLTACQQAEPYKQINISAARLQRMLNKKKDFVLLVERDNCPYCKKLNKYIKQTKDEHDGVVIYRLDMSGVTFERTEGSDQLTTDDEDGQILLKMAPYYSYTPAVYVIRNGKVIKEGIGFDADHNTVAVWDNDSLIDFSNAEADEYWDFVEDNQPD
ncbi:hypothetical protein [Catenisphaera adipataccumulans]|jgi:predicted bacteriocin transport accessory protein|uniref:Putative bacteriocin transport accessory protein n=1 Tax=Catenisphaera adipataccumulans TaxID=700500 RepID=A0A7W8FXA0_9FIRM|nr:hypothetical protein [Catenisphaera adipataccumulans]MBB5183490.1 putative bacteriocin transport accessory protein [Catenisphaera adipataccumulans]